MAHTTGKTFAVPRGNGLWSPAIIFEDERYEWAGEYDSRLAALSVARQLLRSAEQHGFVP